LLPTTFHTLEISGNGIATLQAKGQVLGNPTIFENSSPLSATLRFDWLSWLQISVLASFIVVLYRHFLISWVQQLWSDPYYSHCFFVPAFSLWVIWNIRGKFQNLPVQPNWSGIIVTLTALGILILGVFGDENYLSRSSLLLLIAGLAIQFFGWRCFRAILFPWAVLFLMIPLPRILFSQITLPLQFLSSQLGSGMLELAGVNNLREGNLIHLHSLTLDVAEACSGLRSLMSLITVSVFYGYIFEFKPWQRLILVLLAIPIAIVANGLRIMGTGVVGQYWGPDKSEGFLHSFSGLVVFAFSFVLLAAIGKAFQWALTLIRRRATA
jgi:exosortase